MVDNYFSFKTNYVSFQPNFCISTHHRVRVSHTNGYFLSLEWHYLLFQPMWTSSKPANTAERLAYIADIKPFTLEGGMRIDVTSKPSKIHARLGARNNKSTCFRLSTTFNRTVYHKIKQFLTSILQVNLSLKFWKISAWILEAILYILKRVSSLDAACAERNVFISCFFFIYCKFCVLLNYMTIIKKILPEILFSEQYFFY